MSRADLNFRYRRILRVKEKQEQVLEIEVAQVDRQIGELEGVLEKWQRQEYQTLDILREARRQADLELNARCQTYLAHIAGHVRACREDISRHRQARQRLREDLEQAMRSRKILETYCDRLRRASIRRQDEVEQQITDSYSDRKFATGKESP